MPAKTYFAVGRVLTEEVPPEARVPSLFEYVGAHDETAREFVHAEIANGKFPEPVEMGGRLAWYREEVDGYLEHLKLSARRGGRKLRGKGR